MGVLLVVMRVDATLAHYSLIVDDVVICGVRVQDVRRDPPCQQVIILKVMIISCSVLSRILVSLE